MPADPITAAAAGNLSPASPFLGTAVAAGNLSPADPDALVADGGVVGGGLTISGITTPLAANGDYVAAGTVLSLPRFLLGIYEVIFGATEWKISVVGEDIPLFAGGDALDTLPPASGWTAVLGVGIPAVLYLPGVDEPGAITAAATGNLSPAPPFLGTAVAAGNLSPADPDALVADGGGTEDLGGGIVMSGVNNGDWVNFDGLWNTVPGGVYGRPSYRREIDMEVFTGSWNPTLTRWEILYGVALLFHAAVDVADLPDVETDDWVIVGADLTTKPVIARGASVDAITAAAPGNLSPAAPGGILP